jgi:acetylornithine/N-succinyldiaminopimelate aminotransferase
MTTYGTTAADEIQALEAERVLQVYRRAPIVLVRGEGVRVFDATGREYIDLTSGVGVASLGHANPELARILHEQATTLVHCSNLFYHPFQSQLADKLARLSGLERTFFCNSGTEGMEACLKFARRYWYTRGARERTEFVAFEGAFHGRTMGSLSITADPHYRDPFQPLIPGVTFVRVGDADALRTAVTDRTAAIVLEPIQGEGGIRPMPPAFAQVVQETADRTGSLLICDEIQCGLGRTGVPFYYQALGLKPHLVSIGKAIGSGMPVGAALIKEEVARTVSYGDHGSTYGGNLLACRAGLYYVDQLLQGGLLAHVNRVGTYLGGQLRALASRHSMVAEVRGHGLMWGLELDRPASAVVDAARPHGLLVNGTAKTVVRLLPPLVITEEEIDQAMARLEAAMTDVEGAAR